MRILFEDNPKASISQLLLQVDKSLFFSCGNNNIMRDVIASDTVDIVYLCNKKLPVQQKAKDLYSSLPVTTLKVSNSDEEITSVQQLIKIIMQWYSFYDLLTQSFIKHGKISAKADYSLRRLWWC